MNPKAIGEISEGVILAALLKRGKRVLLPFGNNQRYDMVIDDDGEFIRAQVKTGWVAKGCVKFMTCSTNGFKATHAEYTNEADLFMVYCPVNEKIYSIPVADCPSRMASLRLEPTRGGPKSTIRWAHDHEFQ